MSLRSQVVAQVSANKGDYKQVAGSADLIKVLSGNIADGGCYIFSEGESADTPVLIHEVIQQELTENITLITTVKNVTGQRQINADDECTALRQHLHSILLGFEPTGYERLTYVAGKLLSFSKGFLIYKSTYTTKITIESII